MRIRKHLSGLHLPAVSNPLFKRTNKEGDRNMDSPAAGATAAALSRLGTPTGDSSSSEKQVEMEELAAAAAAAARAGGADGKSMRILKCRTGVLKVYARNSRDLSNSLESLVEVTNNPGAAAPQTSHPRPRDVLKESFDLRPDGDSCMQQPEDQEQQQTSFFVAEENAYPRQQRTPVEHIFPVLRDVSRIRPDTPVEVRGNEEIPIERDLLLPLSNSQLKDGDDGATAKPSVQPKTVEGGKGDDLNQCRRRDGKGWRCHRKTQPAYSLCEYHLDKSRETHQRKLKSNATVGEPKRKYVRRKPVKARSLTAI